MAKQVDIETLRALSPSPEKWRGFERMVIGDIQAEVDKRKGKAENSRVSREKKAKKKRQRAASAA